MYGTGGACGVALPSGANAKYFTVTCGSGHANAIGDQTHTVTPPGGARVARFP